MPILHTLCQQLLMLKIPLQTFSQSLLRGGNNQLVQEPPLPSSYPDPRHSVIKQKNKIYSECLSPFPRVSPSRVENGVILNNLSSHTTDYSQEAQPPSIMSSPSTLRHQSAGTKKIIYSIHQSQLRIATLTNHTVCHSVTQYSETLNYSQLEACQPCLQEHSLFPLQLFKFLVIKDRV